MFGHGIWRPAAVAVVMSTAAFLPQAVAVAATPDTIGTVSCSELSVQIRNGSLSCRPLRNDGVDGVFFGPADLSASMGLLGQIAHPSVVAAIDDGIRRVRAAGKAAGVLTADPVLARHYLDQGALFVAVGIDSALLARAARDLATAFDDRSTRPAAR